MSVPNSVVCESSGENTDPESVIRQYGPLVSALCRRMIQDRDCAQDAAQEVWIEVLKSLAGFRGESGLSTWITVIARRTISRWVAREKRHDMAGFAKGCRAAIDPPADEWDRCDMNAPDTWTRMICDLCLTSILLCLAPETRFIFILHSLLQIDYPEIARIMQMKESTVRQRFSRACRKLIRFGNNECMLINPDGKCRCGQKKYIERTTLVEEFRRMRVMADCMDTWLIAEKIFPGIDYWRNFL